MGERIELRSRDGKLLGRLVNRKSLQIQRGSVVYAVATAGDEAIGRLAEAVIHVPAVAEEWSPFVNVVPAQLLAYHAALTLGRDVDQPRNLAKSVTVE